MTDETAAATIDYSKTLYLPQTEFPMRAGLPQKEPEILKRWQEMDLYARLRENANGRKKYVLHDGPPYANGNLHIGHALNKVLKDVITRSFQMRGFDSNYVPGWDCHGLPIEWKIEEQYRAKGKNKDEVAINEFRRECRDFATHWVGVQSTEFQRLGVTGDFKNPYLTMAYDAESVIAGELMKFAKSGQLYRGSKPIMWSVVEQTALAEAEIEYETVESDTVWVKFPVNELKTAASFVEPNRSTPERPEWLRRAKELEGSFVVIWTTTPWTIPGNRAISFSSRISYGLYEVTAAENDFGPQPGEKLIFADKLAEEAFAKAKLQFRRLRQVQSDELASITCAHPLAGWAPTSPLEGEDVGASRQEGGAGANPSSFEASLRSAPQDEGFLAPSPKGEIGTQPNYGFLVPLLDGDHVTDDAGTGFVHTAPGHGRDDFEIWMANARDLEDRGISSRIPFTVDDQGFYTDDAPGFGPATGDPARVMNHKGEKGDANKRVIEALIATGKLFARGRLKHEYPHSWRSKKPIIFRNTPQWFVHMDKVIAGLGFPSSTSPLEGEDVGASRQEGGGSRQAPPSVTSGDISPSRGEIGDSGTLRKTALRAIDDTRFVPASGQNRLRAMIEQRPDWVLSRQRAWGVPITVFRNTETWQVIPGPEFGQSDALIARIMAAFAAEGADAWYAEGAKERFLDGFVNDMEKWEKVNDILDVWFDSGSTHAFCLEKRPDLKWPADLYLEGSDQHRGWFHSSLLESAGTRGRAPYDAVLTHGFVMAEDGTKMSKSKGNVVTPQDVIKESGADILRLWVMTSDYEEDLRLGKTILQTNIDSYRKIRNTIRWMLGTLAHDESEEIPLADMPELERLMLHRLAELAPLVDDAYNAFDFKRITKALMDFMVVDLSAFYFDIRKDALYCDAPSSLRRRASLHVIREIFERLVTWLAPMLPFTMEEAWLSRYPERLSVHLEQFRATPPEWRDDALARRWGFIRHVRGAVTAALEVERAAKRIGSSLEAAPEVWVKGEPWQIDALKSVDLAEICITSGLVLHEGEAPDGVFRDAAVAQAGVRFARATGAKCERSWRYTHDVGADPSWPGVSARDAAALTELKALGRI
jgi:isoleucyl-tRNA synthetase